MKAVLALFLVAALGVGGWYFMDRKSRSDADALGADKRPRSVQVETRSIRFAVSAAGEITPSEQVSVRPEVNGRILSLPVDLGDLVKKDSLLFQLDDRDLQIEKQSTETGVARAKLEKEQAERDFKRAQELYNGKLISEELFEDARTAFQLAANAVERMEKSLDLVEDKLRKTRVTAPFDCTVLTRPISVGQAVSGSGGFNSGTEVMTIANLNDLVINAHINQADVTRLRVDQEVDVTVEAVPGLKIVGRVERIAPQAMIKNNIKGFAARVLLKDVDKRVRPGMTANISIPVASAENVVSVPLSAVFSEMNPETKQMERFAYVQSGDEWERRLLQIGVSDYFYVEVTRGLSPGETVSLEDHGKNDRASAKGSGAASGGTGSGGAASAGSGAGSGGAGAARPSSTGAPRAGGGGGSTR